MKKIFVFIAVVTLLSACGMTGVGRKSTPVKIQDTFYKIPFGTSKGQVRFGTFPYSGQFGGFFWTAISPCYTVYSREGRFFQIIFSKEKSAVYSFWSLYDTLKSKYRSLEIDTFSSGTILKRTFSDGVVECSIMYSTDDEIMWLEYHNIRLKNKVDARQYNEL